MRMAGLTEGRYQLYSEVKRRLMMDSGAVFLRRRTVREGLAYSKEKELGNSGEHEWN